MKAKAPKRPILPLLLCIALCLGLSLLLSGRAFAFDGSGEVSTSGVTVEIAPPTGYADKSAEIGFTITDTAGSGFASAKVKLGLDGEWRDGRTRWSGGRAAIPGGSRLPTTAPSP